MTNRKFKQKKVDNRLRMAYLVTLTSGESYIFSKDFFSSDVAAYDYLSEQYGNYLKSISRCTYSTFYSSEVE